MNFDFITKRRALIYLVVVGFVSLLLPLFIRYIAFGGIIPIGDNSFYNLRMAESLDKSSGIDAFIVPSQPIILNPYNYLIGFFGILGINTTIASLIFGFVSGITTLILFYLILKRFNLHLQHSFFSLLFLILSPIFIYTFTTFNKYSPIILLQVLGFFLLTKPQTKYFSLLPYLILPFFGMFHALIGFGIVLVYEALINKKYLLPSLVFLITAAITLFYNLPLYLKYGFDIPTIYTQNILQWYMSDLGASMGFGLFALVLFVFGVIATWEEKYTKRYVYVYLLLLSLFVLSYFFHDYTIYLNMVLIIFAGNGFIYLARMKWEQNFIKNFAVLILVLGILFSGVSCINRLALSYPTPVYMDAMKWLSSQAPEDIVVLSHYSNSHLIQGEAKRKVLLDSNIGRIENADIFINVTNNLFYSRSLKETIALMEQYNIGYIFIDNRMKQGLVWSRDEEGLLFLLENSSRFEKVYENSETEIWMVKKE